jgi:DsbC/DsbD-like thiol-disulfide interchange protein
MQWLLCVLALAVTIAPQRPTDIVKWSLAAPPKSVNAGAVAKIGLTATIEDGWKLYALAQPKGGPVPLSITVSKGAPFTLATKEIVSPAAKVQKDELFSGGNTQYYESEAAFILPVGVPKSAAPGDHTVPVDVTFQACGKEICLRPFTQRLEVKLTVAR